MICAVDVCKLDKDPGYGKLNEQRWYYDAYYGECKPFYYYGYGGNGNNFYSKQYCHEACYKKY